MARRTVRVKLKPNNPEFLITLAEIIVKKHQETGENSPVKALKMEVLQEKVKKVLETREEAKELRNKSEKLMQESYTNLGISEGQSQDTPETVLNFIAHIRDTLLAIYKGKENVLKEWGFEVVVGEAKSPQKKPKE